MVVAGVRVGGWGSGGGHCLSRQAQGQSERCSGASQCSGGWLRGGGGGKQQQQPRTAWHWPAALHWTGLQCRNTALLRCGYGCAASGPAHVGSRPSATASAVPTMCLMWCSMKLVPETSSSRQGVPPAAQGRVGGRGLRRWGGGDRGPWRLKVGVFSTPPPRPPVKLIPRPSACHGPGAVHVCAAATLTHPLQAHSTSRQHVCGCKHMRTQNPACGAPLP